jgi:RNAse (barnase) inhibitor barstar
MAWQVAVVLDSETNLASLHVLIGQMPVWALATPKRRTVLSQLNEEFRLFWIPEPVFTVFSPAFPDDLTASLLDLIPTVEEHHSRLSGLSLFGVEPSPFLQNGLAELGYDPVPDPDSIYPDRIRYAKPVNRISKMPQLLLDSSKWVSINDFYDSFLAAVGAPDWHGRNFNALNDSIGTGGINKLEVPYRIVIRNANRMGKDAASLVKDLGDLIQHLQIEGCPVELVIEQS